MNSNKFIWVFGFAFFFSLQQHSVLIAPTFALEGIVRPYQSIRSAGMGGVRLTAGFYDENFFSNPARVTANPRWKVQLPDLLFESTATTFKTIGTLISSSGENFLGKLAGTAGENNHVRIQTTFPGVYIPKEKWSFAFAMISSSQADIDLRRSFNIEPTFLTDVGPAFNVGRKLLENDALSVGITAHATYRIFTNITFLDLIKGASFSPSKSGGEGAHLDFDLGATYELPWKPCEGVDLSAALAINNLFGGKYSNLGFKPFNLSALPQKQPRSLGFGVAARKAELWKFTDAVLALEFTDIGNNPNGSLFRTVHLGGETHYGVLRGRVGINQGYFALGVGVQTRAFEFDLATYGEEMSLNVGGLQDRRFAVKLSFQI